MNDELLEQLVALQQELKKDEIPVILGGGMSFYLRSIYLKTKPSNRYPFQTEARSTNDLDVFLNSNLIVDKEKVEKIRAALETLQYKVDPNAKNFQFMKEIKVLGQMREVKIDLLASPPSPENIKKVEIAVPRIKPKGAKDIHAYLTNEAAGIDIGILSLDCKQFKTSIKVTAEDKVFIPSCYNYIILKLNAFYDRKENPDAKSDYGRHHAYDIFATVSQMNETDWEVAKQHYMQDKNKDYFKKTTAIQKSCFSTLTDIGLLRIQENISFKSRAKVYAPYLANFLLDIKDLFSF